MIVIKVGSEEIKTSDQSKSIILTAPIMGDEANYTNKLSPLYKKLE